MSNESASAKIPVRRPVKLGGAGKQNTSSSVANYQIGENTEKEMDRNNDLMDLNNSINHENSRNDSHYHAIPIRNLRKIHNPRKIPISFEDMSKIDFPDLSVSVEEASDRHHEILLKSDISASFKENFFTTSQVVEFLDNIRKTSQSTVEDQINPITVHRNSDNSEEYILEAGERRVHAAIYRGDETIFARVRNQPSSLKKRLLTTAHENIDRVELSPSELLLTYRDLWNLANEESTSKNKKLSVRGFSEFASLSKTQAGRYHKIFSSEHFDLLYATSNEDYIKSIYDLDELLKLFLGNKLTPTIGSFGHMVLPEPELEPIISEANSISDATSISNDNVSEIVTANNTNSVNEVTDSNDNTELGKKADGTPDTSTKEGAEPEPNSISSIISINLDRNQKPMRILLKLAAREGLINVDADKVDRLDSHGIKECWSKFESDVARDDNEEY